MVILIIWRLNEIQGEYEVHPVQRKNFLYHIF